MCVHKMKACNEMRDNRACLFPASPSCGSVLAAAMIWCRFRRGRLKGLEAICACCSMGRIHFKGTLVHFLGCVLRTLLVVDVGSFNLNDQAFITIPSLVA